MNALTMMKSAAVLLALAAIGGLLMATIRFRGSDRPPSWIAMAHGLLAGSALTLLIYAAVTSGLRMTALVAVLILIVVASVGVTLNLRYHAKLLPLPKNVIVIHGVAAVIGFALLLVALSG